MKGKVHVIPHTHWDREWYFTTSRSKVYLMKDLNDVLDVLENDEKFKYFTLDAQASLLDDYLRWQPGEEKRIRALVGRGKLIIGPWYTQTDQLVISGESIVRNLYYGIERCKEFGNFMKVGYVPDSFGQSAQMPQIYKGFNIEDTLFWRGVSDDMAIHTEFLWEGSDGTKVFAVQMPFGYYYGGNIPEEEDDLRVYLQEKIGQLKRKATTRNVYFPNGFDQAPIRTNLPEILKKANKLDKENEYIISSCENYIKAVKMEKDSFELIKGELINAKHMRIHKSIFSSRADLKIMNNKLENYMTNVLEPILTISYSLGNTYPHETVKDIWRLLFENAAHDSIGACNSDTTNEDIYFRYKQANDIAVNLLDLHMRLISTKIKNDKQKFTVTFFNPLPIKRKETMEIKVFIPGADFAIRDQNGNELRYIIKERQDISDYVRNQQISLNPSKKIYMPAEIYLATLLIEIEEIPSLGYCQIHFDLSGKNKTSLVIKDGKSIENKYFKITAHDNGSLDILDKTQNKLYENQAVFEENGDGGDSYNYSPPRKDLVISSLDSIAETTCLKTSIQEELNIGFSLKVPYDLEERALNKVSVDLPIKINVVLKENDNILYFSVKINNIALSHRVVVLFNTGIAAQFSIADQQFGIIKRPTALREQEEVWEREQWQEKPITIEPMQSFVTLQDENRGFAALTDCVREYQIISDKLDTIAITLFRTFGFMGKEDLLYRPGRASGESIIKTPDAQMLGEFSSNFAVYIYNKTFDNANVANTSKRYLSPIQVYQYSDFLNGRLIFSFREEERTLSNEYSLMNVTNETFAISAIKKAEKDDAFVMRIFNPLESENTRGYIRIKDSNYTAYNGKLDENYNCMEEINCKNGFFEPKPLTHCKLQTIIFKTI